MFKSENFATGSAFGGPSSPLDHEHGAVSREDGSDVAKDLRALRVLSVVDDHLQDVGVAAFRNAVEEAAAEGLRPLGQLGLAGDVRLVEENPARLRVLGEQRQEQRAAAAADVDDGAEA
jgi:hypothetical protein